MNERCGINVWLTQRRAVPCVLDKGHDGPHSAERSSRDAATLHNGDLVKIVGAAHPWSGAIGRLVEQPTHRRFHWRVHFKDKDGITVKAAVDENEVERVES